MKLWIGSKPGILLQLSQPARPALESAEGSFTPWKVWYCIAVRKKEVEREMKEHNSQDRPSGQLRARESGHG